MKYTVRFYRVHDLDLVTYIESHQFNLMHAMYSALTALSKGESFIIQFPPLRETSELNSELKMPRVYTRTLTLDDETDAELIKMIGKITPGYRNSFFKSVLRLYLCYPVPEKFMLNASDSEYFQTKFMNLRAGKRIVQAGKMKARRSAANKSIQKSSVEENSVSGNQKKVPSDGIQAKDEVNPQKSVTNPDTRFKEMSNITQEEYVNHDDDAINSSHTQKISDNIFDSNKNVFDQNPPSDGDDITDLFSRIMGS